MRLWICALAGAAGFVVLPAFAINKCTDVTGKVSFQDAPCAAGKAETIEVKPASGQSSTSKAPAVSASSGTAPLSEAARLDALVSASQSNRRARELRDHILPDAERAVSEHRLACEAKQKALAANQYAYVQNLYGKTHAAQIASERAAAAAVCDTKDRELKEVVDKLAKECAALKCRGS